MATGSVLKERNGSISLPQGIASSSSRWLGLDVKTHDGLQALKSGVDGILSEARNTEHFKFDTSSNAYAYVYTNRADKTIYFGNATEFGKHTGNDTLPGVLVHELSHKSLRTSDIEYGTRDSLRLNSNQKIRNADNWGYFYEKNYTNGI